MGSGGGGEGGWSVFHGVNIKAIPPPTPESLMSDINSAIASLEYNRAISLLHPFSTTTTTTMTPSSSSNQNIPVPAPPPPQFDARMADEAYRAGCAALAAGKLDDALHSLQISLSKCPPHKTSAVSKLQSLITLTSQQLHRSPG